MIHPTRLFLSAMRGGFCLAKTPVVSLRMCSSDISAYQPVIEVILSQLGTLRPEDGKNECGMGEAAKHEQVLVPG